LFGCLFFFFLQEPLNYLIPESISMKLKTIGIAVLLLLFCACESRAQNRLRFRHIIRAADVQSGKIPLIYVTKINGVETTFNLSGPDNSNGPVKMCSDLEGIITTGSGGLANVDFFTITSQPGAPACINKDTRLGAFYLDLRRSTLGDATKVIKVPFKARAFSIATVPFRYRFETDSSYATVTTNLSASLQFGWTNGFSLITHRAINHFHLTLGPFIGVTSVELKESTVKHPSKMKGISRNNIGVSYGGSATLGRNNFGLVFSVGADHGFGKFHKEWSYQDKIWIGLGINTSMGFF
jgi:hypothetical protein